MKIPPGYVGIDISKATLDIFDTAIGRAERLANAREPIATQAAQWRRDGSFVLFEATGVYDRCLQQVLRDAGVPFARVNPARARDFARASGFLAKTDALDARMLAAMAQCLKPQTHEPATPERDRLIALQRRRDQLVAMRASERTRLKDALDDQEKQSLASHVTWLSQEIARFEQRISAHIRSTPQMARAYQRLRSAPGVGPVAATTLLALLPELGRRSPKAIAALAGLAPLNRDSGRFRGKRTIGGGRRRVREALYIAAFAAKRYSPHFKQRYQQMRAAGKPMKVALIAIARKLLVRLNAMFRDDLCYQQ